MMPSQMARTWSPLLKDPPTISLAFVGCSLSLSGLPTCCRVPKALGPIAVSEVLGRLPVLFDAKLKQLGDPFDRRGRQISMRSNRRQWVGRPGQAQGLTQRSIIPKCDLFLLTDQTHLKDITGLHESQESEPQISVSDLRSAGIATPQTDRRTEIGLTNR